VTIAGNHAAELQKKSNMHLKNCLHGLKNIMPGCAKFKNTRTGQFKQKEENPE